VRNRGGSHGGTTEVSDLALPRPRKITRYKCQTCGQEITQGTASAFKLTQYAAMCVQRGRHPKPPTGTLAVAWGVPRQHSLADGTELSRYTPARGIPL
jgi:transposase-like protein